MKKSKSNNSIRGKELRKALTTEPVYKFNTILKDGIYSGTYQQHNIEISAKYIKVKDGYRFKRFERPYRVGGKELDGFYSCAVRVIDGKAVAYKRTNITWLLFGIASMMGLALAYSKFKKKKNG